MDQSRAQLLQQFKRLGFVFIMVPGILVALLLVIGVRQAQMMSYGRMIGTGLNGVSVASMNIGDSIDDPEVLEHFETNFNSLVAQGSFECITLLSLDGRVIASTDDEPCGVLKRGAAEATRVLMEDTIYTGVVQGDHSELLVVAPLRLTPSDDPYAVIVAARPYSLVGPFMNMVSAAVAATVLLGALATYTLLRILIRKAEQEIETQVQRVETLSRRLSASLHDIEEQSLGTLQALVAAVDAKDSYTARHSLNVADYAVAAATHMGHEDIAPQLERAGLLHDIGKIGVPEVLLAKPTALASDEFAAVMDHSAAGAEIITMVPFLQEIVPIVRHHHEHFDGSGYPDGIAGEAIPLPARVLSVADAFDAMTTERPYRKAMRPSDAIAELRACRGSQFDAAVVDAFIDAIACGRIRFLGDAA